MSHPFKLGDKVWVEYGYSFYKGRVVSVDPVLLVRIRRFRVVNGHVRTVTKRG